MKGIIGAVCLVVLSAAQAHACGGPSVPRAPVMRSMVKGAALTREKIDFAGSPFTGDWVPGGQILQMPVRLAAFPFFTGYVILREGRERLLPLGQPTSSRQE